LHVLRDGSPPDPRLIHVLYGMTEETGCMNTKSSEVYSELEDLSLRVLDAKSMDERFDRRTALLESTIPVSVLANIAVVG
jgi:hypothetical protein